MKKVLFLLLMIAVCLSSFAQSGEKAIGLNLGYGSPAIGAKFNYGVTDQIRISPSFNYFLKKDGVSELEFNADFHYLFNVAPKISVYPLAGFTFISRIFDVSEDIFDVSGLRGYDEDEDEDEDEEEDDEDSSSGSITRSGVNIGCGIAYQLSSNISIGFEVKYRLISDFEQLVPIVPTINLTYKF